MMSADRKRKYNTYNKFRFSLFTHSYAGYFISYLLRTKYKIDNKLTGRELRKQLGDKRIIPEISRLAKVLNFNYKSLWNFIVLTKSQKLIFGLNDQEKVKAYLSIENEITALIVTRQDKESLIEEEYKKAILTPAIERAAGNYLKDIEDDSVFNTKLEELQRKYSHWYYKVAYRYKLPTIRILPFILRLIIY